MSFMLWKGCFRPKTRVFSQNWSSRPLFWKSGYILVLFSRRCHHCSWKSSNLVTQKIGMKQCIMGSSKYTLWSAPNDLNRSSRIGKLLSGLEWFGKIIILLLLFLIISDALFSCVGYTVLPKRIFILCINFILFYLIGLHHSGKKC